MADPIPEVEEAPPQMAETLTLTRKEKRKSLKKLKRKLIRQQNALTEIEEEEARLNDQEEQARIRLKEQEEAELRERQRREFEEREKAWLEAAAKRKAEDEERERLIEESRRNQATVFEEDDDGEYVEDGPPEIIWQGNEIIVRKRKVKVAERIAHHEAERKDDDRPTSNPLPPESAAFAAYNQVSSQQLLESVAQQTPNFGTEQDKAHCPFHLKTGACRFGSRCSRVHFYPDKSCTLLVKNMYSGPGLAWEQDEGLEIFHLEVQVVGDYEDSPRLRVELWSLIRNYTDEEVEHCYEEFYEDVHTEFLKFGEIVNFKVCRNGSAHLRGNVYLHYKSLESAILAYNSINGRYFAGKQISCEYVGVTRWKVAICGEFMKSRLKACSRGSTCNFLHCFRNPGGDYEWADWDNPPPKHWLRKMAVLFGPSNDLQHDRLAESENQNVPRKSRRNEHSRRHHSRRSRSRRKEWQDNGSDEESSEKSGRRSHSSKILHSRPANSPEEYKQYDKDKSGDYHLSRKRKYLDDDSSRHHNHLNQSEQERDSSITLYGGHEDDSDLELNDKEQNNRRGRRSLRKTVDSPNFNEHCGTSKENGHGSYTSGRDSHEKRSYFDNSNRRRRRSSRRELSSRYEENIDADDHGRYAENYSCAAEDNEKHHSDDKSSGDDSSRSSRKRYAPDQKKEVKSLNDRTRLEDDDRVSKKYDSDYLETEKRYYKSRKPRTEDGSRALERSQDKNDNDGFEEHYRNLQSNADSGRGGSKRTVQEGGCLGEENNKPDRRASEKRRRSRPKDRHSSKTRKEETCDSHREASVANI